MIKKIYWNGAYYNSLSKDVEKLKQQAPHLYAKLFPRTDIECETRRYKCIRFTMISIPLKT